MAEPDSIHRAMTRDGSFRVIVAQSTQTVAGVLKAQAVTGSTAVHFGNLVTATALYRAAMSPDHRVQGILRGSGDRGKLIADSHPDGTVRGLVQWQGAEQIGVGDGAKLQLMRTLRDGQLAQGVVEVPERVGVAGAMMAYLQNSEQVTSMVAVETVIDGGQVVAAGGYIVQLTPETRQGPLMVMTERLVDFEDLRPWLLRPDFSPALLSDELLFGMEPTTVGVDEIRWGCWCSEVRVLSALASLPRVELEQMLEDGEPLETRCDYCGAEYVIQPSALRGLLTQS